MSSNAASQPALLARGSPRELHLRDVFADIQDENVGLGVYKRDLDNHHLVTLDRILARDLIHSHYIRGLGSFNCLGGNCFGKPHAKDPEAQQKENTPTGQQSKTTYPDNWIPKKFSNPDYTGKRAILSPKVPIPGKPLLSFLRNPTDTLRAITKQKGPQQKEPQWQASNNRPPGYLREELTNH